MRIGKRSRKVVIYEILGFSLIIVFLWLVEIYDISEAVFHGQPTPVNIVESIIESILVAVLGFSVVFVTIRSLRQIDDLMTKEKEQNAELAAISQSKDKLVSIISHDLRSPLNPIIGFAQLLYDNIDNLTPVDIAKAADQILVAALHMNHMLENLLKWSHLQRGTMKSYPENFSLNEVVTDVIHVLSQNAAEKRVSILSELEDDTMVYADQVMINSVLQNLVSNALKFSREGGTVTIQSKKLSSQLLEVSVIDGGVGIPDNYQEKLFRSDTRHSSIGTKGELGSGLGLIICKELVEKNGGTIHVESKEDQGTAFKFTIPLANDI